ncbi:MAG TPA: excinuclease ABC subunit UvrA [Candidatus Binataceae bacterium]|nr:excinuclease ABC subunit UvrA [Candidatus Binataceae bacterium]
MDRIIIKGAREHNLKNLDIEIPRDQLVVITGLSGSGKSSLAFDTIYAEGQRRYVESLSAYARQFLEQMEKPDLDSIEGLSPAISIEQKSGTRNPRSTVATITEIYDYLRLLFARVGHAFCYNCGREISQQSVQQIVDRIRTWPEGTRLHVLAPIVRDRKGEYKKELADLRRAGFVRVKIDGELLELSEEINLNKNHRHSIDVMVDRLALRPGIEKRLADSLEVAFKYGEDLLKIEKLEGKGAGEEIYFSQRFACVVCGISYPEITPRMFSFNSPHGACPECSGIGSIMYFDPELVAANEELSIADGAIAPWATMNYMQPVIEVLAAHYKFRLDQPWKAIPLKVRKALLNGSGEEAIEFGFERHGHRHANARPFEGILMWLDRRYKETESENIREWLEAFMNLRPCPVCTGTRLKKESLFVRFNGKSISEVTAMSIKQACSFFTAPKMSAQETAIASMILKEVRERLGFLAGVGLDYLNLDRTAGSLSGGEGQRIRLATQIGSSLVGVLYILDEPSIGLHQRDNERLLATLKRLKALGNSVIVVEHDRDTMLEADHIIDMGPGAGIHGGHVVAQGTPAEIMDNPASMTGKYLSGELEIAVPARRRPIGHRRLTVRDAHENNLRHLTVAFPLGVVVCVTGVSGSGKSTLVLDTVHRALAQRLGGGGRERPGAFKALEGIEHLDKVIHVDQSPIGRTPRSNPATYTGLFTHIRELFAQLPDARMRGYGPGRFSFNVKGGRCEACQGDGIIRIEMHFLPDVYVTCEVCGGKRYNRDTLEVQYKGKSIAEVLDMTALAALDFMSSVPPIRQKLETLRDVGLDYVHLGQSATTLSGGEAQRIKLAKELARRATGRTLYILDEPTTGLHFDDIKKLLTVLGRLADSGNTIIVIEHNLEVIKTADYIIDLGPEGGDRGGQIVAEGSPEEIAAAPNSHTGHFLRQVLGSRAAA